MIDDVEIPTQADQPEVPARSKLPPWRNGRGRGNGRGGGGNGRGRKPTRGRFWRRRRGPRTKPRVRKLRLILILIGLGALAVVSTVFGMMMAVASDLPQIENRQVYSSASANSYLYDDHWHLIGQFAPPNHEVIDSFQQTSPWMRRAIVSVEDRRFWTDPGVDLRGIARAAIADLSGGSQQGASTIAEQFVKNALSEQDNRTILEKLREAALAYHLTRRWPKQRIMTQYLNSIYFGNGAYGVESAARVYFGKGHGYNSSVSSTQAGAGCGDAPRTPCASVLEPWEAALLAGMVADPSAFDPVLHPAAAWQRRDQVLKDMLQQHYITEQQYLYGRKQPLPTAALIQQPQEAAAAPYFTSWLRPQILAAMGLGKPGVPDSVAEYRAYYGGLKIRTTIDLSMEQAADQAISQELPSGSGLPGASLVAIDNKTGEVRAMVGGPIVNGEEDYNQYPFNLATESQRQPGSAFKPFTLAMALESGKYGPDSIIDSAPQNFIVPNSGGKEHFIVHNFGNTYSGPITLQNATDVSDNTVYTQVGINVGTKKIAHFARRAGIRTPVSDNYAMIIGGLKIGVSPLDMAHAYETFAEGGRRVYDPTLGAPDKGPTGIAQIYCPKICPQKNQVDEPQYERVLPAPIAAVVHQMLTGVVQSGTATSAAISGVDVAGKTGTTTNYADAWFVGWTPADDDRGVGRLPEQARADEHPVQRRAGRGRHLPGDHLAQLHGSGPANPREREPAREDHDRVVDRYDERAFEPAERIGLGCDLDLDQRDDPGRHRRSEHRRRRGPEYGWRRWRRRRGYHRRGRRHGRWRNRCDRRRWRHDRSGWRWRRRDGRRGRRYDRWRRRNNRRWRWRRLGVRRRRPRRRVARGRLARRRLLQQLGA